jgi:hypothetical protein
MADKRSTVNPAEVTGFSPLSYLGENDTKALVADYAGDRCNSHIGLLAAELKALLRDRLKMGWRFEAVHDSSF